MTQTVRLVLNLTPDEVGDLEMATRVLVARRAEIAAAADLSDLDRPAAIDLEWRARKLQGQLVAAVNESVRRPAQRSPVERFCDDLVAAATAKGSGIAWRRGAPRAAVEAELARRGLQLREDGDAADPRLKRFCAF